MAAGAIILAVEDDPSVRLIVGEMLSVLEGFTIHLEASPAAALEHFPGGQHGGANLDLLISDIVMPGMNGFELAERMSELYPDLKVLFVSGYDSVTSAVEFNEVKRRAGYLSKPFDCLTLLHKINQVLSRPSYSRSQTSLQEQTAHRDPVRQG